MNQGIGPPGYFDRHYANRSWEKYRNTLSYVIIHSRPGPILDLGAGCGYFVEATKRWNLDCIGLEGSKEAIDMARKRYPAMDIRHHLLSNPFPFEDDSFQTVLMNQVIEHLEPMVALKAVSEAYRVLVAGGLLYITSPRRFNQYERKADPTHINMTTPKALKKLLHANGFEKITAFDTPLPILGQNRVALKMASLVFRWTKVDRLSASANCFAYKKQLWDNGSELKETHSLL